MTGRPSPPSTPDGAGHPLTAEELLRLGAILQDVKRGRWELKGLVIADGVDGLLDDELEACIAIAERLLVGARALLGQQR